MGRQKWTAHRLASALGISDGMVSRYRKAGMPLDLEGARAWRLEHVDDKHAPDGKPQPAVGVAAGTADSDHASLKRRLLAAEVTIREDKAKNAGGVSLPSIRVERGLLTGLQLLRASINGSTSAMYGDVTVLLGDRAGRELLALVEDWWRGVHDAAADAILLGLQRELPIWGRDFHKRYLVRLRGNFPDEPFPNEPRALDDVPEMADLP